MARAGSISGTLRWGVDDTPEPEGEASPDSVAAAAAAAIEIELRRLGDGGAWTEISEHNVSLSAAQPSTARPGLVELPYTLSDVPLDVTVDVSVRGVGRWDPGRFLRAGAVVGPVTLESASPVCEGLDFEYAELPEGALDSVPDFDPPEGS